MTDTPKVGDVVLFYERFAGNEIRTPVRATVEAVYPLTQVGWARPRMMEYSNAVDLVYFDKRNLLGHRPQHVPYTADVNPVNAGASWSWP